MNRVDLLEDLENIRKRLVGAGWDNVTISACALVLGVEKLHDIDRRLDKIEDRIIELKGDS